MDNRRETYRHLFDPEEALRIEVVVKAPRETLPGVAINLSLSGMRARLFPTPVSLQLEQLVTVHLLGDSSTPPFDLNLATPARIKYIAHDADGLVLGLLFPLLASTAATAQREKALGRFLMQEQRRRRRRRKA